MNLRILLTTLVCLSISATATAHGPEKTSKRPGVYTRTIEVTDKSTLRLGFYCNRSFVSVQCDNGYVVQYEMKMDKWGSAQPELILESSMGRSMAVFNLTW